MSNNHLIWPWICIFSSILGTMGRRKALNFLRKLQIYFCLFCLFFLISFLHVASLYFIFFIFVWFVFDFFWKKWILGNNPELGYESDCLNILRVVDNFNLVIENKFNLTEIYITWNKGTKPLQLLNTLVTFTKINKPQIL